MSMCRKAQLDAAVRKVKHDHPNDGEIMVAGHLLEQGICVQHAKLCENIHCTDPNGVVRRRSFVVKRRAYYVTDPNEVWHINNHHKLIKW